MLVYFAVIVPVLLGFCGLAIDLGRIELRQVQLQAAADAGALGAAGELQRASSTWQNAASAEVNAMASLNGFPAPTVSVQKGASSGPYASDQSAVQVTVTQTVATIFIGLTSIKSAALSARAVATIPPCMYFSGSPSPFFGAGAMVLASQRITVNCPIYSKTGYDIDGFSRICCNGQPRTSGSTSGSIILGSTSPAVAYNTPVISDPLAYIPAPAFSHCDFTNKNYVVATTISPGTYCGTLKATGTTLTMNPGLYIITGGVQFNGATINGTGVTMYLTQGGGSSFGAFILNAGSTMHLSAPTDGSAGGIPAILLFGDRAWGGMGQTALDFVFDQSSFYGDGIIYTTNTGIYDWQTQLSAPHYFTMVTSCIYAFNANITPLTNFSPLPGGDPFHLPLALVQ